MKRNYASSLPILLFVIAATILTGLRTVDQDDKPNAGLVTPQGFTAVKLIEGIGKVRHITVTQTGNIYARLAKPVRGQGTLFLKQIDNKATVVSGFGNYGGTGVQLYNGYLYTASNSEIFRYKIDKNEQVIDTTARETIVTGLLDKGTHETKSIMMDKAGNMYIPIGCPSNSCQQEDRKPGSMGITGCPLLDISGGVWQFKPDKLNQTLSDGKRYATGLRNVVAIDWNTQTNQLYVMQHGRDQLNNLFPGMYDSKQNAETPAECMYALKQGDNAGWPYIYYDRLQHKKMQAPEYGGDGKKEGSAEYIDPVAAFPAHMAPNDILFYTGNQFPAKYKHGAFVAFHGSWNRGPEPQAGYFVIFQPFKDGKPFGEWENFADGFSGSPEKTASGRADHRPCGLAQGPDGSLYVSDDVKGAIYKISYGKSEMVQTTAVTSMVTQSVNTTAVTARSEVPAAMKTSYDAGAIIYAKNCAVCHQNDGGGVQNLNAPLIKTDFVLGDKNKLIKVLLKGMSGVEVNGEKYSNVMPSQSFLSDKQTADVLTYVRNSFGNKASAVTAAEVAALRKAN
jgi:glucose/arabinose dehydrogenase/cytochrome c5